MRRYLMTFALTLAATGLAGVPQVATAADATAATNSDPNFRWHNGKWWYWMADRAGWLVWDGNQWQTPESMPRRAARSFSYQQDDSFGSGSFRAGATRSPQKSGRITGSFGHRGAGSKITGSY